MRVKSVKRYYCDHCSKGYFVKSACARHESVCFRNPDRKCWLCEEFKFQQPSRESLMDAEKHGIKELRNLTQCPVCILSALVCSPNPEENERYDYKAELREFYSEMYNNNPE